jgi:tRNA1Val (adenine37-N6)-methyltransferase
MPNNYFQFKQFTINQGQCAMKVGTDGVLLGAWVHLPREGNVLDVGCGTGLISLMVAQRSHQLLITALDIDYNASIQAKGNVEQSPWKNSIEVFHGDFFTWKHDNEKYNLIITNPPFYNPGPDSSSVSRDIARSEVFFPLDVFFSESVKLLTEVGDIALIVPFTKKQEILEIAELNGLFPKHICNIKPTPEKKFHRVMLQFSKLTCETVIQEMVIESEGRHHYSPEYKELTKDFYLKMS